MPSTLELEATIEVGKETFLPCDSPEGSYGVVFEDNGETAYLYGISFHDKDYSIVDAMHIYNVDSVVDKDRPSKIQILWTTDGLRSALLINGYAHAVFDFEQRQAYCLTNFPEPSDSWTGHQWSDAALDPFE
jgi:hypothetical protein